MNTVTKADVNAAYEAKKAQDKEAEVDASPPPPCRYRDSQLPRTVHVQCDTLHMNFPPLKLKCNA
eukprot:4163956-Pleurochrysis_carterae.AAC.1